MPKNSFFLSLILRNRNFLGIFTANFQEMRRIGNYDISLMGHKIYKENIIKTYPQQYVSLIPIKNNNGYEDIFVDTIYGKIGQLYAEDSSQIISYVKNQERYYIEAYIKKTYLKDILYEGVVLIINIYEKDAHFVVPEHPFLGNYVVDYPKYFWGLIPGEDSEYKLSIADPDESIVDKIDDMDSAKLVINNDVVDVYHYTNRVGHLHPKASEKIIPYLQDGERDVVAEFIIREERGTQYKIARLEILIKEKKKLKGASSTENKAPAISAEKQTPTHSTRKQYKDIRTRIGCFGVIFCMIGIWASLNYITDKGIGGLTGFLLMLGILVFLGVYASGNLRKQKKYLKENYDIEFENLIPIGGFYYGDISVDDDAMVLIDPREGKINICAVIGADHEYIRTINHEQLSNIFFRDSRGTQRVFDGYESYRGAVFQRRTRTYPVYKTVKTGSITFTIQWKENNEEKKIVTKIDENMKEYIQEYFMDKYVKIEYVD